MLNKKILMDERDYYTIQAMRIYGGSFVFALAQAAERADPINLKKIKQTWPEYWKEYEEMGDKLPREK